MSSPSGLAFENQQSLEDDMKLSELMAKYFASRSLKDPSIATYQYVVASVTRDFKRDPELEEMTLDWVIGYRERQLKNTAAITFNSKRRHMLSLLTYAVYMGWIERNVFKDIKGAPVARGAPKALHKNVMADYIRILETAYVIDKRGRQVERYHPQFFWLALVKTMYYTGMRMRQVVGLRWDDIDFHESTILLRSDTSKTLKQWTIPLPPQLRGCLVDLHHQTAQLRRSEFASKQVFCLPLFSQWHKNFATKEMNTDNVANFFKRFNKSLPKGSPRISAHRIRHTTGTQLAKKVKNIKVVQTQLGHSSINTTLQYVSVDIDDMREAVAFL
jgi:integrase